MRNTLIHLGAFSLALGLTWAPSTAQACGGFFCDNVNPVVQTAERVLFRINDDDTTTVIVEVQYQGPPSNFGWILPVAAGITTDDLGTAPPGLFDALEEKTAPRFERPSYNGSAGIDDGGSSCGLRRSRSDFVPPPPPDTSGVEVVGEAVVGPYAVELITAEKAENLSNWLIANGYQISPAAIPAIDHYIDREMAFIGLKLTADVPAGPVDAFSFTVPGRVPSLPLVLTSVAASADMEIITYVAGAGRHVPANGEDIGFDYESVRWVSEDDTDYPVVLREAIGDGYQRWNTEFASILGELVDIQDTPIDEVLDRDDYLNRYHSFMSPAEMTYDPYWMPSADAQDLNNLHYLDEYQDYSGELGAAGSGSPAPLSGMMVVLMPLLLALPRRRRTFA